MLQCRWMMQRRFVWLSLFRPKSNVSMALQYAAVVAHDDRGFGGEYYSHS